jgi:AcrR family transcriptional regulator
VRSAPAAPLRPSAQDRILAGVTELAGQRGYADLTVERLLEKAGVSRASFYQYFLNVDDCFASAYRGHADELVRDVGAATRCSSEPELQALRAIAAFAAARPSAAGLLLREGLAAGPLGLEEREQLLSRIVAAIAKATALHRTADVPSTVLVGGVFRFLVMRLSDGGPVESISAELDAWVGAFRPDGRHTWSDRLMPTLPEGSAPPGLGTLRPQGSVRERIVRGTALAVRAKGYKEMTVADIVCAAGVSRRSFYNEFASKQAAFIAAYELGFEQALAACAPAFFSAQEWHERVWQSALAFTSYFAREPSLAHLGFVECHALGRKFASRVHQTQLAFTLFLEDGYRQSPGPDGPARISSPLSAAAIAEIGFLATRASPSLYLRRMQPLAVYIALTPFVGCEKAGRFVSEKIAECAERSPPGSRP